MTYEQDPYLTALDTAVLETGEAQGRPCVVLEDTVLYPEGGGQPSDRGQVGSAAVVDVQKVDGIIRHILASPVPVGPVRVVLDWERRFDHMQQHTGQHVLTAVAQERFGWETTAFHLGEERCDIELDAPSLPEADLAALEEAVAQVIREARAVSACRVTAEAYASMRVRSRGLPEGHQGDIRLVEIEGLDLNTCGGTHVRSTAELECVKLLGTEAIRGGTRLYFVVGRRARRRLEAHERRNGALRTLLGAPDEGLLGAVEQKLEQIRSVERRCRALEDDLAAALTTALAAQPGTLVERHFEGRDAGFLQKLARQVMEAAPEKVLFLTATAAGAHAFTLTAGPSTTWDTAQAGKEVCGILEAKGGGAKGFFQGKAASLARRDEALALLHARRA